MGSANYPVQNKGLFRNLPTFSPEVKGLTALVTGANGISGFHTLRVLLESPQRWSKLWAVSRRPPPTTMLALLTPAERTRFEHVAIDFLEDPKDIAKHLKDKGVSADIVFFYSYTQPKPDKSKPLWSNAQELSDINASLLRNFLGALDHIDVVPKRVLLQTGAKSYGIHLGPARTPFLEFDPRVMLEPNFYYAQEDILYEYCKSHRVGWNVIRPAVTIGAVTNAAMNPLYPLAVYGAVQAQKGEKLDFRGNLGTWLWPGEHSTAKFTSYLSEWAVLEDKCKDQAFNASDGTPLPHNRLWPEIARWYGALGWNTPICDPSKFTKIDPGEVSTPLGYGPGSKMQFAWSMCDCAERPENQKAWKAIMAKHDLTHNPFDDVKACFAIGDVVTFGFLVQLSMNKARTFGWTGHVDTLETLYQTFSDLNKLGMLPPLVAESRPLI